jgi:hypothetical protein
MAKNIPITARVSKGLFGQKATEPVLNVGQAGVYGNNITKGDPSPGKMMNSPLKQTKTEGAGDKILKGQANVVTTTTTPSTVIKGTPGGTANIDQVKNTYNKIMPKGWKPTEAERAAANKRVADAKAKDAASGTPDQVIPGETVKERDPLMVFNEGSAKTSFWRRQDDRAVTHTSRKKKRADIQLAKLEAKEQGKTSKEKREYISDAKNKAKKEMWTSRQAGYKGSREAAVGQAQQSTRVHDAIKGVNLDPNRQQVLNASQVGRDVSEASAITQGKARAGFEIGNNSTNSGTTNPAANTKVEMSQTKSEDVKKVEATKTEEPKKEEPKTEATEKKTPMSQITEDDTPLNKTAKGFFAKRGPLKMKYFK